MDKKTFLAILYRHLQGTATPEEEAFIDVYYRLFATDPEVLERLAPAEQAKLKARIRAGIDEKRGRLRGPGEQQRQRRPVVFGFPFRYVASAVAAVLLVAFAFVFYVMDSRDGMRHPGHSMVDASIIPGGNRATLVMEDGQVIPLSEMQDGIVISGDRIAYADGTALMVGNHLQDEATSMIRLATPRGGTYRVTLTDGSRVWLNAGSTLKYPVHFVPGQDRIVELEGEAYFEVARTSGSPDAERQPFIVKTQGQTVEVLGTQFNINAYANEPVTKTTLVEGLVQVSSPASPSPRKLNPGEQALVDGTDIGIRKVDVTQFTAWKEGIFNFEGQSLRQVMKQLERWYDVEVVFNDRVEDVVFRGKIFRNIEFQEVLYILRKMGIKYEMEGRTLTIIK